MEMDMGVDLDFGVDLVLQEGSIDTKIDQLKMIIFFTSIEEDNWQNNLPRIKQLAEDMNLSKKDIDSTIEYCEKSITETINKDFLPGVLRSKITDLGKEKENIFKIQSLWLLVNCAYYEGICSTRKKEVLINLTIDWSLPNADTLLLEMEETVVTLTDIKKYKEWIKSTNYPYDYIHSIVAELEKSEQELAQNITLIASIG